jgi:hypothetical protein
MNIQPVAANMAAKRWAGSPKASCKSLPAHINTQAAGNLNPSQQIDGVGSGGGGKNGKRRVLILIKFRTLFPPNSWSSVIKSWKWVGLKDAYPHFDWLFSKLMV